MYNNEKMKKDDGEVAVLLQFKQTLIALSLQSNIDPFRLDNISISKKNVLKFEKSDGSKQISCIFLWENNGKIIDRINIPIKANKSKKTQEVFEANEALRMVKIGFHEGEKFLCINEQPKYLKIMDTTGSKLHTVQEYYVNDEFGVTENVNEVMKFIYIDGVLYDNCSC